MISFFQAIILSIVQGVTEWFPVSSSGHLAILHNVFGFQSLSFDVFLHLASIFAVLFVFRREIIFILNLKKMENWKYILMIIIGIIPAGIAGFFFKEQIEMFFSDIFYLGLFFIISGIFIYSTKFFNIKREKINFFDSFFIGIIQAFAILPGISRSGATISAGIMRGLKKEEALKFSFLLSIPLILGAGILEFKDFIVSEIDYQVLITSFILTFITSMITIKILFKIVKSDRFYLFGIYNFVIGIIILISMLF